MSGDLNKRKVTRVLVMLEYGPDDPETGEVFDLTALAQELQGKVTRAIRTSEVTLDVTCEKDWRSGEPECYVAWRAGAKYGDYNSPAGRLVDAVNCGLPEGEKVTRITKSIERAQSRIDKLEMLKAHERLRAAAEVRSQHPIARVTASPLADVAPSLTNSESEVPA
jgi:hypothetical protein